MSRTFDYSGRLSAEPALPWSAIQDSPFLPDRSYAGFPPLTFRLRRHTLAGGISARFADRIVPNPECNQCADEVAPVIEEIIAAYPEHRFTGRITARDEEGYTAILDVADGRVTLTDVEGEAEDPYDEDEDEY